MALTRPNPAVDRDHNCDRIINHRNLNGGLELGFDKGPAGISKALGVFRHLFAYSLSKSALAVENLRELIGLLAKRIKLLFNFDGLKPCQLPQPKFKNIFGLKLR